jgi:hypothetical protein
VSADEDSSIWWRIESRMEKKSIFLYGFILSPRQVLIMLFSLVAGYLFSLPIPLLVAGIPFLGKGLVILAFLAVGFIVSGKRIKMTPPELVLLYNLSGRSSLTEKEEMSTEARKEEKAAQVEVEKLPVSDFMKPTPYNIGGKLQVAKKTKLVLLMDGQIIEEKYVSPSSPHYWFTYLARPEHIGTHELEIKVEGVDDPIWRRTIAIFPQGREDMMLEVKK